MGNLRLAWRNLFRHRVRTALTLLGVVLGLALVQTYHNFTSGVYAYMVDCGVRAGSGHLTVYRRGYLARPTAELTYAPEPWRADIAALPGVKAVLPRVHLAGLAQSSRESRNIRLVGADLPAEGPLNPYLRRIDPERLRTAQPGDAFVGAVLLRELRLRLGSRFVVTVQSSDGEMVSELFHVRGIVQSGIREVDGALVVAPWAQVAALAGHPGTVHELAVLLEGTERAATVLPAMERLLPPAAGLEAVSWERAMPNLHDAIRWDYVSVQFLSVIVLAIVTIGVVNSLLMSVMERMREFGLLRALGVSRGRLCLMVVTEGLLFGALAVVLGTAVGALATAYLVRHGFDLRPFIPKNLEFGGVLFSALLHARWDPRWMAQSAAYIGLLCVAASLYPGLKASRAQPVETLRRS